MERIKTISILRWPDLVNSTEHTIKANEFNKVAGYKSNTQKSIVFLYNSNEQSKSENKKTILFTVALQTIKYSTINKVSAKLVHCKQQTLLKEIKDLNKRKYTSCSWIRGFSIIKMSIFTKLISRFKAFLLQIPAACCAEIGKLLLKFHMKVQGTQNCQNNLEKEHSWRTHTSGFQKLIHSYRNQGRMVLV